MNEIYRQRIDSPIGPLLLSGGDGVLLRVEFLSDIDDRLDGLEDERLGRAVEALQAYFSGAAMDIDVPLDPAGTDFQRQVWSALRSIPYGATCSYRELAGAIGRPRAVRAVGAANGANPIPIVIPCHRVIGADGSLTGYGGGLGRKRWLLELEARVLAEAGRISPRVSHDL